MKSCQQLLKHIEELLDEEITEYLNNNSKEGSWFYYEANEN